MPRRPALPGPESTREAILDAAETLFARQGFERTTIKAIGAGARVNPALIYYYHRDKTGLYHAVLDRLLLALTERVGPAVTGSRSAEEMIRGIITAQVNLFHHHPRAASLFIRELVDHDAAHAKAAIGTMAARLFRPACQVIEDARRRGAIRGDVDSQFAAISTIAQVVYFSLAAPAVRILLERGPDFPTDDDIARFGRHAAGFAIAALRGDRGADQPAGRATGRGPRARRKTSSKDD